jgi:hypothetical protein
MRVESLREQVSRPRAKATVIVADVERPGDIEVRRTCSEMRPVAAEICIMNLKSILCGCLENIDESGFISARQPACPPLIP